QANWTTKSSLWVDMGPIHFTGGTIMLMRIAIVGFFCAGMALLWIFSGADSSAQGPATKKPAAAAATKAVQEDLNSFMATGFVMQEVKDEAVGRAFPSHVLFGVYFRQYPVARLTPKGMSNANVYAVGPDGKARLLKDAAQLQDFFKTTLGPA